MSSLTVRRARIFMFNWTLAVLATVCAFVVHLAMRGRTVSLGYELWRQANGFPPTVAMESKGAAASGETNDVKSGAKK